MGTSPLTATVSSLPPEPEQPASTNSAARAHGTSSCDRLKLRDVMTASLSVVRLLLSNSLPGNAAVAAACGRQSGGEMQGPGGIDDDGVDAGLRLDQPQAALEP